MQPDARSPSETDDTARVAFIDIAAPEMDVVAAANRRLADIGPFLIGFLSYALLSLVCGSTDGDRHGIAENETTDPRLPLFRAPRRGIHAVFEHAMVPQSDGGNSINSTSDTTTQRPGTAHATPQGEGRRRRGSTNSETTRRSPDSTANVDGSRGLAYRSSVAAGDPNEDPAFVAVIGLLAFDSCVIIGLVTEFDHTVGGWSAAATVSYGLLLLLDASLTGFGVIASVGGTGTMLWVSDLCARLGAILCSALLIVAISCKMGRPWGCGAGVPLAAVMACVMGAIGVWARARALWGRFVGPRRRRQSPGGDADVESAFPEDSGAGN
ncbi:unnamed protein product [Urochloa humidicola]